MAASSDSFRFLEQLVIDNLRAWNDAFAIIGLYYVASKAVRCGCAVASAIRVHFLSRGCERDFAADFGSWAVVTGGSDGIGLAYAEELAKRRMNVVLLSKDEQSLKQVAESIHRKYLVQVHYISVDFNSEKHVYKKIEDELRDKEIGVLVNNVASTYDYPMPFVDVQTERLWQIINVNIGAVTMMTHMLLPQMLQRGKGAIVNVAAGTCSRPMPQLAVYAATKAYVDLFSRAVEYECAGTGVVVQCLQPFYVMTAQTTRYGQTLSYRGAHIPTAAMYASHAVCTLGRSSRTTGYWPHTLEAYFIRLLPDWLWMWGASRLNGAIQRQARLSLRNRSNTSLSEL